MLYLIAIAVATYARRMALGPYALVVLTWLILDRRGSAFWQGVSEWNREASMGQQLSRSRAAKCGYARSLSAPARLAIAILMI